MESKKERKWLLMITFSLSILILIGIVIGGTYSFYSTAFEKGPDLNHNITASSLEATLLDGEMTGENLIPGDVITKKFQIKNTGTGEVFFKLFWKSVTNNFINKNDLIITLEEGTNFLIHESDNQILPDTTTSATVLKDNMSIPGGTTKEYTLKIIYKNTEEQQIDDIGKSLSAVITIGD
ncbi:MAG: hypothetical protein HFH86_02510 [Bacilli bacterium]|jgi:hypothetical protein|nr:hypothetical protein [Bacilli bacterium]